jgi:cell division protease FtsH
MAMGGKVAEELIFGKENVTSGAASDIQQVSKIARAMVTQFGFSDKLGNIDYANEQQSYLGSYNGRHVSHSADTQQKIDDEVRRSSTRATRRAKEHPDREDGRPAPAGAGAAGIRDADRRRDHEGDPRRALKRGDDADRLPPPATSPRSRRSRRPSRGRSRPKGGLPEPT